MLSVLANSPTATMLQRPAMPCTALAPTGSSTCDKTNYIYSVGEGAENRFKLSFVLQKSAFIKS